MDVVDGLLPPEIAKRAEEIGVAKASMPAGQRLGLSVLAGAFIALGAVFSTVAVTNADELLPYGLTRLVAGVTFCLGLVLVVVGGAELFTGNNLVVMAWASGRIRTRQLLAGWAWVYAGNFLGALGTAVLVVFARHHHLADGAVGVQQWAIARAKVGLEFGQAVAIGTLCNALVCLAIWLTLSTRSTAGRILAIVFPVTAFVTSGFEHCVANMYYVPVVLLTRWLDPAFVASSVPEGADVTWTGFLAHNLLPVTVGNLVGGVLLVAGVYWLVYLGPRRRAGG
ncbi:MAG: formate/nitrite transporter family protein [Planctomycetota bacterium]